MNDQDLRDCFAMFAMMGFMSSNTGWDAKDPWDIADRMLEARRVKEEPQGIVAIKKKRTTR